MKQHIIIINGLPRSGKDTFVELCMQTNLCPVGNFSTVDFVKDIAGECGWAGTKRPEDRRFLSELKRILNEWDDVANRHTAEAIQDWLDEQYNYQGWLGSKGKDDLVVFVHIREPLEIEHFRKVYFPDAVTLCVCRPGLTAYDQSNDSDKNVADYRYDYYIDNDSDLAGLAHSAQLFMKQILQEDE